MLSWLVILLGVAGAAFLLVLSQLIQLTPGDFRAYRLPYLALAAVGLAVAAGAVVAAPRRFGAALLAGWVTGGVALTLRFLLRPAREYPGLTLALAATLLGLLVIAVPLARTTRQARQVNGSVSS